jgi:hypothetical protein
MPLHGSPPKIRTNETDEPVHSVGQPMISPLGFMVVLQSPNLQTSVALAAIA